MRPVPCRLLIPSSLFFIICLKRHQFCKFYLRSIGKVKEAEAIEQQMRAKGGSVPPSGGPQVQLHAWNHKNIKTCLSNFPLSVWWTASVWGSAPVWRSASGWATVLLSWLLGGLANNHPDLDYQVRFSHHSASFQAYLCSLSHFLKLATLVQSLSCLAITLINYYFTVSLGLFSRWDEYLSMPSHAYLHSFTTRFYN